jgi:hypothetical protein
VVFSRTLFPLWGTVFYLRKLLALPLSAAAIRSPTRDLNAFELDPDRSCAFLHGKWLPFVLTRAHSFRVLQPSGQLRSCICESLESPFTSKNCDQGAARRRSSESVLEKRSEVLNQLASN